MFAKSLYNSILNGNSVNEAFENAKTQVNISSEWFNVCCCDHDHDPKCVW